MAHTLMCKGLRRTFGSYLEEYLPVVGKSSAILLREMENQITKQHGTGGLAFKTSSATC